MHRRLLIQTLCYIVSAAAMLGATAFLVLSNSKDLGIVFLLIAVIISRVLILDFAIPLESKHGARSARSDRPEIR